MYFYIYVYVYICVCMCICVYRVQAKTLNSKRFRRLLLLEHHQKAKYLYFALKASCHTKNFCFSIAFDHQAAIKHDGGPPPGGPPSY